MEEANQETDQKTQQASFTAKQRRSVGFLGDSATRFPVDARLCVQ